MITLSVFALVALITLMLCLTVIFCLSKYQEDKQEHELKMETLKKENSLILLGSRQEALNKTILLAVDYLESFLAELNSKPSASELENPENIPH